MTCPATMGVWCCTELFEELRITASSSVGSWAEAACSNGLQANIPIVPATMELLSNALENPADSCSLVVAWLRSGGDVDRMIEILPGVYNEGLGGVFVNSASSIAAGAWTAVAGAVAAAAAAILI